ncbi:uncharacterized protein LOC144624071 [Crassostrea virginica]
MIMCLSMIFLMSKISVRLYFLASIVLFSIGISKDDNACPKQNFTSECCSGYRMIDKESTECIGFFGTNCKYSCPSGWYGPRCIFPCNCSKNETWNQFVGCLPKKTQYDISQYTMDYLIKKEPNSSCSRNETRSSEEMLSSCILW